MLQLSFVLLTLRIFSQEGRIVGDYKTIFKTFFMCIFFSPLVQTNGLDVKCSAEVEKDSKGLLRTR